MGVPVPGPVPLFSHQPCRGVAEGHRDRVGGAVPQGSERFLPALVDRVGFGSEGVEDDRFGHRQVGFGPADEPDRFLGGQGQGQRPRIGQPDVFGGEPDDPPDDVQRVFPRFQHSGQPVQGGVRIRIPHRFVKGADQVEVFFAILVVNQGRVLNRSFQQATVQLLPRFQIAGHEFQHIEGESGVSSARGGDRFQDPRLRFDFHGPQAPLRIFQRCLENGGERLLVQSFQPVDPATGEERGIHFE